MTAHSSLGDLFAPARGAFEVALHPAVEEAARAGAWFSFSLSGGKDCGGISAATMIWLDSIGHPRDRRFALHADLGRAEWKSTPAQVEAQAAALGLPLTVVRRKAGDLFTRFQRRFELGLARYRDLLLYNMIGPWASASMKFCQSELKIQVMGPHLARTFRGQRIVQVVGLRREESDGRAATPVAKVDHRFAKPGNRHGTEMLVWHPGVDWKRDEVIACNKLHGVPLHEGYTVYNSSRLSCAWCIFASHGDQRASAQAPGNHEGYRHLVGMEADSTFSFQPARWLGDVAPQLLSDGLRADLRRAKMKALDRRRIEAELPARHRYVDGWPLFVPTQDEAALIVAGRRVLLARHGLDDLYPSPVAVQGRFEELISQKNAGRKRAA